MTTMNKYIKTFILIIVLILSSYAEAKKVVIDISEAPYYFIPDVNNKDNASRLNEILISIKNDIDNDDEVVIRFKKARYDFYPHDAQQREYYVSNHDQGQPKLVGICLEGWDGLTLDGKGSEFIFHGQMLPLAVAGSSDIILTNFSIDFENPHIAQVEVVSNDGDDGITFRVEPWVDYRINENGVFETYGEGWKYQQYTGIAFEKETRHIVYNTSDLWINTKEVQETSARILHAPNWTDKRLNPGTIVAMRTWQRPAPGIFLDHCNNIYVNNVSVHYAEGMGLLAQRCCNIRLNKFNVCLRDNDARYFTTQADATHFSQCKGMIRSENGLYEGMMDDAINVHGIYLKVRERVNNNSLVCSYEHNQAWGFAWGDSGDSVCFVKSKTMEMLNHINIIKEIKPYDKDEVKGCKVFLITFEEELPDEINTEEPYGIENLSWTPEVIFRHNIVRNNRARGALFSSPLRTVCEDNIFDHTSGTAILLCGDCNGWYESGAVRDLLIKNNTFINALTNMFQFTNAVISIYPEIPDLENQVSYFHGGKKDAIVIEKNHFITFDMPLLYAKSVDGLIFRKNKVTRNNDYKAFHWNQKEILLEKTEETKVEGLKNCL